MPNDSSRERQADSLKNVILKERRERKRKPKEFPKNLRLGEVRKVLIHQYHGELDASREDLRILLHHVAGAVGYHRRVPAMLEEIKVWAPHRLAPDKIGRTTLMVLQIAEKPITWSADKLGRELQVTMAIRDHLNLRTIGAMEVTKEERATRAAQRKKQRDKEAAARRRGDKRKVSALKPWLFEGIDRRTWERSGRAVNGLALWLLLMAKKMDAANTSSHKPASLFYEATDLRHRDSAQPEPAGEGGAGGAAQGIEDGDGLGSGAHQPASVLPWKATAAKVLTVPTGTDEQKEAA